jgi:hypothetical protein
LKSFVMGTCVCLVVASLLTGCSPNKQQGTEDRNGNQAKFDAYGINIRNDNAGTDKGAVGMIKQKVMHNREPELIARLEAYAEKLPGVMDIKVLAFKDNLLVGVLPVDTPKQDEANPNLSLPHTSGAVVRSNNGHTDALQKKVVDRMRVRLVGESRFNVLYVSTNPAIYDRISNIHREIEQGTVISDQVFQVLISDIGYTTKGYSL